MLHNLDGIVHFVHAQSAAMKKVGEEKGKRSRVRRVRSGVLPSSAILVASMGSANWSRGINS